MNIDSNYNSQFIQIDFKLLDDPAFLQFVHRTEFATYLILRRFIWRKGEHRLGLHELYRDQHKLASSIGTARIARLLGIKERTRVSKHLSYLVELGVVQRYRTGRESIFILGEWHKPAGWKISREFYYLDNHFGRDKSDVSKTDTSDVHSSDVSEIDTSDVPLAKHQSWPKRTHSNREENREMNTVSNGVKYLPDLELPAGEIDYLTQEILEQLGDEHSRRFYHLVASKVPEPVIRKALAEIKTDGAEHPARVFTDRMSRYAIERLQQGIGRLDRAA